LPLIAADAGVEINGRSLAISGGRVFFRSQDSFGNSDVLTFDELTVDDLFEPAVTTVVQPAYGIGFRAAEVVPMPANNLSLVFRATG